MNRILILIISLCLFGYGFGQELNCKVQINSDQISGSNKSVFNTLQKSITDFMNNRRWTDMTFSNNEKIDCSMNIIIKSVNSDRYVAELQVQSRRPVYNSSYTSSLLNYKDNSFNFEYNEFDQLEFNDNSVSSNLTAMLAYYAYLIIGLDMDSYSRLGGTPFFQEAESIVNSAQAANLDGWKAFESSKNRYALMSNLTDEAFKKFRNYFYEYHRLGLDEMMVNATNARAKIAAGLSLVRDANRARPSAILISLFMDTKTDELINIFSKGTDQEKKDAVEILSDVSPAQTDRFEKILK